MMRTLAVALVLFAAPAFAQGDHQHVHPTETITGATAKFYESWRMPDNPDRSCCSKADCYATEARYRFGHWQARRREDGKWLWVPDAKVEQSRDNPDGRSHMCAPPPSATAYPPDTVFCFSAGVGG